MAIDNLPVTMPVGGVAPVFLAYMVDDGLPYVHWQSITSLDGGVTFVFQVDDDLDPGDKNTIEDHITHAETNYDPLNPQWLPLVPAFGWLATLTPDPSYIP